MKRKSKKQTINTIWKNNSIQFPRLLAEIHAIGLTQYQLEDIADSMDLTENDLMELFYRAIKQFNKIKEGL